MSCHCEKNKRNSDNYSIWQINIERNVTGIISLEKAYNMYPLVSGEFTPMEYYANVSSVLILIMKADTRK